MSAPASTEELGGEYALCDVKSITYAGILSQATKICNISRRGRPAFGRLLKYANLCSSLGKAGKKHYLDAGANELNTIINTDGYDAACEKIRRIMADFEDQ